ncbi:pilus assembly protein [Novosphingobium sp. KCTC 2891]|uniref:TadE/TadG family type IV pilus assembly protein n=1 Tax=Novosphingobium sp. KCTC 2891 TaxID=2989730 RepID=UPI00222145CA|nr:TadE/TadG family type IV pilus assembly protein [Novosphingobium sp. KCTC 2891]MCW1381599.1 pilus assembly protein [Novosphingobium sp. KCTC 2891]
MSVRAILAALWRDQSGAAAVETMLIAPVAVMVMALAMESGHFLYSEHQVLKGVRDAARYASRLPLDTWNCTAATAEANLSSGNARWLPIARVAVYGNVAGGTSPRLWTWSAAAADGEVVIRYSCVGQTTGLYSALRFAPRIVVIAKPNYPSLFGTLTGFRSSLRLFAQQQAVGVGI